MAQVTAKELLNWLKTQVESPCWTVGKLDNTKEQTICIYSALSPRAAIIPVAGSTNSYAEPVFRILVRWTKDFTLCAEKAMAVHLAVRLRSATIAGKRAYLIPIYDEPVNLGTDDKGIYEHSIDIKAICER